ncbi:MAG: hypothetical protein ACI9VR_003554 [Cognaticolwellia sp.]|jgi:hypothetical protein
MKPSLGKRSTGRSRPGAPSLRDVWVTRLQSLPRRLRRALGARVRPDEFSVLSNAGTSTHVHLWIPEGKGPWPLVLLTPGTDDHSQVFEGFGQAVNASEVAGLGVVCATFDPAGRGKSWGEEDYGGPEHQDQVRVVLQALQARPDVDAQRTVVVSISLGLSMAAGALASFKGPVLALVDWEGPSDREVITAGGTRLLPAMGHAMDDESYWQSREGVRQVPKISCGYWRLQAERDHAQPGELRHAQRMLEAAQGLPWVRINEQHGLPERIEWLAGGRRAANEALLKTISQAVKAP